MIAAKENYALEELAQELDNEVSSVAVKLGTLNDVRTVLGQLRIKMDNLDESNARIYFHEIHTSVRLIDDLIEYTMEKLNVEFAEIEETKEVLFQKIVREGDKK